MPSAAELIATHIGERRRGRTDRLLVGICGAQGSGKSTVAREVVERLVRARVTCAVVALDDFYLTKAQRLRLGRETHPLLSVRGPPGTHDTAALRQVLDRLRAGHAASSPTFDKLLDDRAPGAHERLIQPADVILLEGWCLGAEPETRAQLAEPINDLERTQDRDGRWRTSVNDALTSEYSALFAQLDALIFLRAPHFGVVTPWRLEQERANRSIDGEARAMSPTAVADFVQHYERITQRMLATPPAAVTLTLQLDDARHVISVLAAPASRPESR